MEFVRDGRLDESYRACTPMSATRWPWCWNAPQRAMTQMALHADRL
ncbi:hypothetical protein [Streptomyces spongiae]|nr:hypothetical protein [Streptomyces spongiae]